MNNKGLNTSDCSNPNSNSINHISDFANSNPPLWQHNVQLADLLSSNNDLLYLKEVTNNQSLTLDSLATDKQNGALALPTVVLIHAKEEFLPFVHYAKNCIKNSIIKRYALNNYTAINQQRFIIDKTFDLGVIVDIINHNSLFSEANFIELNYNGGKPNKEQGIKLQEIIVKLTTTLDCLLIITNEFTNLELQAPWLKQITNANVVLSDNKKQTIKNNSVKLNWLVIGINNKNSYDTGAVVVKHILRQRNISIDPDGINLLLELNHASYAALLQEAQRLCLATVDNSKLTQNDIKTKTSDNAQYSIYQLSNAYLNGNLQRALQLFDRIYKNVDDAILISWLIGEDLRRLLKYKDKIKHGHSVLQICQDLRLWGDIAKAIAQANKRLGFSKLIILFDKLTTLDSMIKGIIDANVQQELRQIIIMLSG